MVPSLHRKKLTLVNISDCNVYLKSINCLRVAWSIAAALVIECKFFETDNIVQLFLGNGVVCIPLLLLGLK